VADPGPAETCPDPRDTRKEAGVSSHRVRAGDGGYRSDLNAARISAANSSGSSQAAKWPPLSASWRWVRVGWLFWPQLRGARRISRGKVVKPTGSLPCGGGCPAARAWARPLSQYARAAEAPVPVSQYRVMLSRMWLRVRFPDGCPPV